jgi:hypothetical protein
LVERGGEGFVQLLRIKDKNKSTRDDATSTAKAWRDEDMPRLERQNQRVDADALSLGRD